MKVGMHSLLFSISFRFSVHPAGALRASYGSEFGDGGLGIVIGYSDCYGDEPQFGNCSGFSYPPYIPSWYCNNNTLAGVKCLGMYTC